jgi:hypothetical protein
MKNHPKMLQEVVPKNVDTLYLDSNSIVYDCYYALLAQFADEERRVGLVEIETRLCNAVVDKIRHYISYVKPVRTFVAFDGVAPLSKMDQQRLRRHKSMFTPLQKGEQVKIPTLQSMILPQDNTHAPSFVNKPVFNTNAITPGTPFMKRLTGALHDAFDADRSVVLSTSEEPGEGEHKLFADLRDRSGNVTGGCGDSGEENTGFDFVVYGLDADLIMLSLLHLRYCSSNLWIFREAPHFGDVRTGKVATTIHKKAPSIAEEKECLHLNVGMLSRCILDEMGMNGGVNTDSLRRLDDYVFLCFFLGNDFLPHFPCLNIRTHGMPYLLAMYRECCGKAGQYLVDSTTGTVIWSNLQKWIQLCALREPEWFTQEREARNKMATSMFRGVDKTNLTSVMDQAPLLFRGEEYYIDAPRTVGWQKRYYRVLFGEDTDITAVCNEYLQGLQWVWQYYTGGCRDWRWRYPYTYAPLMQDLYTSFPFSPKILPSDFVSGPLPTHVQLAYVLPRSNHSDFLLDTAYVAWISANYGELYVDELREFHWSYCRYFWEAHPVLPEISLDTVTEWSCYGLSK